MYFNFGRAIAVATIAAPTVKLIETELLLQCTDIGLFDITIYIR